MVRGLRQTTYLGLLEGELTAQGLLRSIKCHFSEKDHVPLETDTKKAKPKKRNTFASISLTIWVLVRTIVYAVFA